MSEVVDSKVDSKKKMPTTKFEEILCRFMQAIGVDDPAAVPAFLGLSRDSLDKAKKRGKFPSSWYFRVSEKTDISSDWIKHGTGPMRRGTIDSSGSNPEACLDLEEYHLVPLLESRVMAGPEGAILYDEVADHLPFKRFWIEKLVGRSEERKGELLLVRVRGESMSPTIDQGEIALVDTHESERISIQDDKIYLVVTPEGTVALKRLVVKHNETGNPVLLCLSDNKSGYRSFTITVEPGKSIKQYVLGRVRWAGKEFD